MFDAKAIEPAAIAILASGAIAVGLVALLFWFFLRRARDRAKAFNLCDTARSVARASRSSLLQENQSRYDDYGRDLPSASRVIEKR